MNIELNDTEKKLLIESLEENLKSKKNRYDDLAEDLNESKTFLSDNKIRALQIQYYLYHSEEWLKQKMQILYERIAKLILKCLKEQKEINELKSKLEEPL